LQVAQGVTQGAHIAVLLSKNPASQSQVEVPILIVRRLAALQERQFFAVVAQLRQRKSHCVQMELEGVAGLKNPEGQTQEVPLRTVPIEGLQAVHAVEVTAQEAQEESQGKHILPLR
jgi:hypothetical protein